MDYTEEAKQLIRECNSCRRMVYKASDVVYSLPMDTASRFIEEIHEENGHTEREARLAVLEGRAA